jgi:ABC-type amino acid transport substrate-binding protein
MEDLVAATMGGMNSKMQNITWLLIKILVVVLFTASCRVREPSNEPTKTTSAAEPKKTISVVVRGDFPPFSYIDAETNKIVGFDIDLMDTIAERTGLLVDYEILNDWSVILKSMDTCSHDAYFSRVIEFLEDETTTCWQLVFQGQVINTWCGEEETPITFTIPYFQDGLVVIVKTDNTDILTQSDLQGREVGVDIFLRDDSEIKQMVGNRFLHSFTNLDTAYQALMDGDLDAIMDYYTSSYKNVMANEGSLKIVGKPFSKFTPYVIAVCNHNVELLNSFNSELSEIMSDGTYDDLFNKWLVIDNE